MCRLLGVVAREPLPLSELLADDLGPFFTMACEHADGWGVASVTPERTIAAVKEPVRADVSPRLRRVVRELTTDSALLHIRMASPQSPVIPGNTHPFGDQRIAFAHNGDFTPVDCLDSMIGEEALATAEGGTDSERFSLGIRLRMDSGMEAQKAIMSTVADIRSLARSSASLNCMLLTPDALYAYAAHDPHSDVIHRRGPAFFALKYRVRTDAVVVASTGWPQDPPAWTTLPEGHVLEIRRDGLSTVVHAG
ncbi:class II glutamine amidotransferase [Streptomyces cocklensis]|uniref:Predicted glutamine amidotransferase n=1 Tax=Actinacidiphila cocklensis TaxID=887465 RepID=A0A9W4DZ01_9ACTN|nr:class II glutamine amidotransferase [Actinacidiphila cocklensis]MDD1064184.1 class II glutamine amidotransferase [Actinacidiphila cocklensis]WSX75556.1 class II glutamine amidotransferase [Streptomyces sp. NBC_00899]CAG6398598.1 Predicted glutamine amidotransferase [Actinacidiphila cocklensis]